LQSSSATRVVGVSPAVHIDRLMMLPRPGGVPGLARRERFYLVRARGQEGRGSVGVWCRRATCRFSNWPLGRPAGPVARFAFLPSPAGPIGTFTRRGPPVGVARWLSRPRLRSTGSHQERGGIPRVASAAAAREIFVAPPPTVPPRGRREHPGLDGRPAPLRRRGGRDRGENDARTGGEENFGA